jgi:hypothetical protein
LPEFGVKYDHMFAFGNRPQPDGMAYWCPGLQNE